MAYTYSQFLDAANNSGLYGQFSAYDLELAQANPDIGMGLLSAKQDWNSATTDAARAAANARAESLRSNAYNTAGITSYTGGSWGNEYNPIANPYPTPTVQVPTIDSYMQPATQVSVPQISATTPTFTPIQTPSFDASQFAVDPYNSAYTDKINELLGQLAAKEDFVWDGVAPEYENRYDPQIQEALGNVTNYGPFVYDKNTDPVYQAVAQQYRREGDRAARNALAAAATRSGGANSSAALAASQQTQNAYGAALSDRVAQLYSDAYSRYNDTFNRNVTALNALQDAESRDYEKFLTALGQYNNDRSFALDTYNTNLNKLQGIYDAYLNADRNAFSQYESWRDQQNNNRDFAYGTLRDQVSDQKYNSEMAYQAGLDAYNAAVDQQKLAYDAALQNAGFTQDAIDNAYRQQSLAYDAALQNANLQFDAYDRQLELAQLAAKYKDYSGLNSLGITPAVGGSGSGLGRDRTADDAADDAVDDAATETKYKTEKDYETASALRSDRYYVNGYGYVDEVTLDNLLRSGAVVRTTKTTSNGVVVSYEPTKGALSKTATMTR